jgi:hypothetical protein
MANKAVAPCGRQGTTLLGFVEHFPSRGNQDESAADEYEA